ncbi:hypothetical protein BD309DRAFT_1073680 [Dichomitus squalens]|nr:hypothetical protein BD309DRAFT_1073680 [Dichomitus squalens]
MPRGRKVELNKHTLGVPQPPVPPQLVTRYCPTTSTSSMASFIKLSQTPEQLDLFCNLVEYVAKQYNENEAQMRRVNRSSATWAAFEKMVQQGHSFLIHSYQNAWPVWYIVCEHRWRKSDRR